MRKLCFSALILYGMVLTGCYRPAPTTRSPIEKQLATRAGSGIATKISKLRRQNGIPALWPGLTQTKATVRAYIVGPASLTGKVTAKGVRVNRFVISSLTDRVNSKERGVCVDAIFASNAWPETLQMDYSADGKTHTVTLKKMPRFEDWPPHFLGTSGAITLDPWRPPAGAVVMSKGKPSSQDRGRVIAVEQQGSERIRYILVPE